MPVMIDNDSRDAITEMINIGVGRAAGILNEITGSNIKLRVPNLHIIRFGDLPGAHLNLMGNERLSTVMQEFHGNFSGTTSLAFSSESAASLVQLLSGETGPAPDMDAVSVETLKEVGNIIINAVMGSISNVLAENLVFTLPEYCEGNMNEIASGRHAIKPDDWIILAQTQFMIESMSIEGMILLVLEVGSLDRLVQSIQKHHS
jgi:chemotaxis protein CheC